MIVQVFLSSILVLVRLGLCSDNLNKTLFEHSIETFVLRLGISFYVSTLTSKFFRKELMNCIVD